jgi:FkbM family methyltransferase
MRFSIRYRAMQPISAPGVRALPLPVRIAQTLEFPHKLGICERLFAKSLARHGICWVRTAAGVPWKLDLSSPTHRWIVYGKYEGRGFLDWARAHLPPDGLVVDSGANIGQVALYLAQWVPRGRVLAVEPGQAARSWLCECLLRNPHLPVEVLAVALGDTPQTLTLKPLGAKDTHGSWNQVRSDGEGEVIDVMPLAHLLDERGIRTVDLWKLDVEGYELMALAGAKPFLREQRIRAIYAELGFGIGERIRELLAGFGYAAYQFTGRRLRPAGALAEHTNALFLPSPGRG